MKQFKIDNKVGGYEPILQSAARLTTAKHECKAGNIATALTITGVVETKVNGVSVPAKCGVKYLGNGYVQYQDNSMIECYGAVTAASPKGLLKGAESCFHDPIAASSRWLPRTTHLTRDMDEFRTVGSAGGTDVDATKVRCFNTNKTFTETGTANCWAYEITSQKLWGDAQYLWMAQPSCGVDTANKKIEGVAKCK
jgi:hypothetical protein